MFEETKWYDLAAIEKTGRAKTEMRVKMDALSVGEGFVFRSGNDLLTEKRKAQKVADNLNPFGKGFSVRWIDGKTAFRVVRTR